MNKVYTLLLAFTLIGSVNAQVTKHTSGGSNGSMGTTSNRSESSTQRVHSNERSNSGSKSTYPSKSTEVNSRSTRASEIGNNRVERMESKRNPYKVDVRLLNYNKKATKETTTTPENRSIYSDLKPYIEEKKEEETVPANGPSTMETIPYPDEEDSKNNVMPEGLSQSTTTLLNNGIRINNVIVTCDDFEIGRNKRWEILSQFEIYDLSMVKRCQNNFPREDRWIITCDEFEKSNDARKTHILLNENFYNLDEIKNCDSYLQFKSSLPVETEE